MNNIAVNIAIKTKQKPDTPFVVSVSFKNKGKKDAYLLSYETPLEGLFSDCFEIYRDGIAVPYDGPIAKRSPPTKKNYVVVPAGKSVVVEVDVSSCYQVSVPGNYTIKYKGNFQDVLAKKDLKPSTFKTRPMAPSTIAVKEKGFVVEKIGPGRATLGEVARRNEETQLTKLSKKKAKKKTSTNLESPIFVGGSSQKRSKTVKAHKNCYAITKQALTNLRNDSNYKEWFGSYTTSRFNQVKKVYKSVVTAMESSQFTYNLTGDGCQPNWFAYTYKGTTTIWFCGGFWSADDLGTDSKAGTVLHEHTHATAFTDDIAYGQSNCRSLAIRKPASAIKNADSYEYFAGG